MAARDWSAEFLRRREIYDAFRVVLSDRLGASIDREAIALSQIESRTKTVKSFIEKVTSKGKYANPLEEMTDLVGLRVIVYYPDDVRAVGTLIEPSSTSTGRIRRGAARTIRPTASGTGPITTSSASRPTNSSPG